MTTDPLPIVRLPPFLPVLQNKVRELEFSMSSDLLVGSLLRTLTATKPGGRFLELGTGLGLSLAWMVDGMDDSSTVLSLDNDAVLTDFVRQVFSGDTRVTVLETDGESWIEAYHGPGFDLIFADTWPGKYNHLDETLTLLNPGGLYVIDDMNPQPNWPEGHARRAADLVAELQGKSKLKLTALDWSTGVLIATHAPTLCD